MLNFSEKNNYKSGCYFKKILIFVGLLTTLQVQAEQPPPSEEIDPSTKQMLDMGFKLVTGDTDALMSQGITFISNEATSSAKSFLKQYFTTVELELGLGEPSQPNAGLLVVAPIYNSKDIKNTLFTQASAYYLDSRTTLNLGLGYRRLEFNNKLLLGLNGFYDQELPYNHGRVSIGLEARTTVGELNLNKYWGVTSWKATQNNLEERALGGFDVEFGVPLPYMNWVKVYARGFIWDSLEGVDDLKGTDLSLRAQLPVLPGFAIEAGHRTQNSLSDDFFVNITYNLMDSNTPIRSQRLFSESAYQLTSMETKRFEKVRRENLIVKQVVGGTEDLSINVVGF